MQRFFGGCLMVVALIVFVGGLLIFGSASSVVNQLTSADLSSGTVGLMDALVAPFNSLLSMGLAALGAVLAVLGLSAGLVGYLVYPKAISSSPTVRKVVDVIAIIAGIALILAMLIFLYIDLSLLLHPERLPSAVPGGTVLLVILAGLLLLALGVAAAVRGVRNLRGVPAPLAVESDEPEELDASPVAPVASPEEPEVTSEQAAEVAEDAGLAVSEQVDADTEPTDVAEVSAVTTAAVATLVAEAIRDDEEPLVLSLAAREASEGDGEPAAEAEVPEDVIDELEKPAFAEEPGEAEKVKGDATPPPERS
ncbi:MAG: hypothetical protein U9R25_06285 [Chloroflexota bacterium]|nr:hypothetical protein [Chloroflexota bacterium]